MWNFASIVLMIAVIAFLSFPRISASCNNDVKRILIAMTGIYIIPILFLVFLNKKYNLFEWWW